MEGKMGTKTLFLICNAHLDPAMLWEREEGKVVKEAMYLRFIERTKRYHEPTKLQQL